MTNEIPEEIVRLRARLAELEELAASHDFNQAVRRAAGHAPPEAEPKTPPTEPEPPVGFNAALRARRRRRFTATQKEQTND